MADDNAKLVMGDSDACFDVIGDIGARPAALARSQDVSRERQRLLRAAIAYIHRQHGSGGSWACYVGPAGAFDVCDVRAGEAQIGERPRKPM